VIFPIFDLDLLHLACDAKAAHGVKGRPHLNSRRSRSDNEWRQRGSFAQKGVLGREPPDFIRSLDSDPNFGFLIKKGHPYRAEERLRGGNFKGTFFHLIGILFPRPKGGEEEKKTKKPSRKNSKQRHKGKLF